MTRSLPATAALQAFESAAFHLSFTRAAEELHVTQGAISRQIQSLEQHLGAELFVRERQRIRLSPAGEHYLPEGLPTQRFYEPVARGLEGRIAERLAELRALDEAAKKPR